MMLLIPTTKWRRVHADRAHLRATCEGLQQSLEAERGQWSASLASLQNVIADLERQLAAMGEELGVAKTENGVQAQALREAEERADGFIAQWQQLRRGLEDVGHLCIREALQEDSGAVEWQLPASSEETTRRGHLHLAVEAVRHQALEILIAAQTASKHGTLASWPGIDLAESAALYGRLLGVPSWDAARSHTVTIELKPGLRVLPGPMHFGRLAACEELAAIGETQPGDRLLVLGSREGDALRELTAGDLEMVARQRMQPLLWIGGANCLQLLESFRRLRQHSMPGLKEARLLADSVMIEELLRMDAPGAWNGTVFHSIDELPDALRREEAVICCTEFVPDIRQLRAMAAIHGRELIEVTRLAELRHHLAPEIEATGEAEERVETRVLPPTLREAEVTVAGLFPRPEPFLPPFLEEFLGEVKSAAWGTQEAGRWLTIREEARELVSQLYEPPAWATGYITDADAAFLAEWVLRTGARKVIELGMASGTSTAFLGALLHRLHGTDWAVHSLDPMDRCYFNEAYATGAAVEGLAAEVRRRIHLHRGATVWDLDADWIGCDPTLFFIDACHWHPHTVFDLAGLVPHLHPGDVIVLHDINLPNLQNGKFFDYGATALYDAWLGERFQNPLDEQNTGALIIPASRAKLLGSLLNALEIWWQDDGLLQQEAHVPKFHQVLEWLYRGRHADG